MTEAERFDQVCSIFEQVRELEPELQTERLIELCSDDEDLLKAVQGMLGVHQTESPLDQPSNLLPLDALVSKESFDRVPQIDRYEIGKRIGEGGMGMVYAAEMRNPRRPVAIKVIRLGMNSQRVMERFDLERQAIARMEHPNIATILDAGVTADGRPYFAMELIRGQTIVQQIENSKLESQECIELIIQVCNAIQHAHQRGIIHRDIKPSNIIVTQSDGEMIPKVIDFGIAKATQDNLELDSTMTAHAQAIGTPAYMSPEQADPSVGDVDTRTDVYSLGVILYEILTRSTPLVQEDLAQQSYSDMLQIIRDQDPPRPSVRLATTEIAGDSKGAISPEQLKGDLDWIVMKCLEKDPDRRYETVSALGEDLDRYLRNEPVFARPASKAYIARKFVRRHRGSVIASSVILGVLLLGVAGTTAGLIWAIDEKERAELLAKSERASQIEAREASERAISEAKAAEDLSEFFILDVLSSVDPSKGSDRELTVREALVNASENIEGKFEDRPDVEARIHNALGFLFTQLGSPELAEPHHIREWEIAEDENGEFSIDAARMMHSVVASLAKQGRDAEAIELTNRQLRVLDMLDTEESKALRPRAIGNLAALMIRTGQYRDAIPVLEETLITKREIYGDRHPTTLSTINNLASVLKDYGEVDRAIVLASEAYQGRNEVLGPTDPRTFVAMINLGSSLTKAERFSESIPMLRQGYEDGQESLGSVHPTTIDISNTYARSLIENGEAVEAERISRMSVQVQSELDPEMIQARTLTANSTLASSLSNQEKYGEATLFTTAILSSLRESNRENHHQMSQYLRQHGNILLSQNLYKDAESALSEAWRLVESNSGDDQRLMTVIDSLINLYEAWHTEEPNETVENNLNRWEELKAVNEQKQINK